MVLVRGNAEAKFKDVLKIDTETMLQMNLRDPISCRKITEVVDIFLHKNENSYAKEKCTITFISLA